MQSLETDGLGLSYSALQLCGYVTSEKLLASVYKMVILKRNAEV